MKWLRLHTLLTADGALLIIVVLFATRGFAFTCPPCEPNSCPQDFRCSYGIVNVKDVCSCCPECAKGPGEQCGGPWGVSGICTIGSRCLVELEYGQPYDTYIQAIGLCQFINESSTPVPLVSPVSPTTPKPRLQTCRTPCNIDFCQDGLNRYCSAANGTAFALVEGRDPCQHTTCKACRLHVSSIGPTCPEPVNKRCLRHYFLCLAEHYKRNDIILKLSDPRALNALGKIICHVPGIDDPESEDVEFVT